VSSVRPLQSARLKLSCGMTSSSSQRTHALISTDVRARLTPWEGGLIAIEMSAMNGGTLQRSTRLKVKKSLKT